MSTLPQGLTTCYITDGTLENDRFDVEAEKSAVKEKWKPLNDEEEMDGALCGNIRIEFENNVAALKDFSTRTNTATPAYFQISSALALYRTISLFECGLNPERVDFYKMNWEVILRHQTTGILLALGEWKGGFQIFTPYTKVSEINNDYKKDAEELLTLLVSPKLTIGYDGTVAGKVA